MASITFTVTRSANTDGAATLNYTVIPTGENPARPVDFLGGTFPSGIISFGDGDTAQTITVNIASHAAPGRTFAVHISNPSVGSIKTSAAAGVIATPVFEIARA